MTELSQQIYSAIRSVVGGGPKDFIPLHEPSFSGREREYVIDAIDSTFVSSVGSYVDRFEKELADFCGVERAVATVNGTAALHIALLLAGVEPGDEVLVPTLTFVATANAVSYIGAIPHFIDSEEATMGVDPVKLDEHLNNIAELRDEGCYHRSTGRPIRAVVPMHAYGHPMRIAKLMAVAEKWGIVVVEDAAESLGSYVGELHTGSFGHVSAVSFNGNKIVTAGGGGAILTNDCKLADRAKHLTTTAKRAHRWRFHHDAVGYNYRMPNLNAALITAQLEQLPNFLAKKRHLAECYTEVFDAVEDVCFVSEPEGTRSNYWLCTLLLHDERADELEKVLESTNGQGIMTRPTWDPMHTLRMFIDCPRSDLSVAENLSRRILNIPSSAKL